MSNRIVDTSIKAGDRVRSYDFPHRDDCYIEGRVLDIHMWEGCDRYAIRVERVVWEGTIQTGDGMVGGTVNPPVNGIPTYAGTLTSYVHRVGA